MKNQLKLIGLLMLTSCIQYAVEYPKQTNIKLNHPYKVDSIIHKPIKLHPEMVSTNVDKFNTSFSPDGNTIYYTATHQKLGLTGIAYQKFNKGTFSDPEFVPFVSSEIPIADVQISPDGKTMLFSTFKDYEGKPEGFNFNIWKSELIEETWQEPTPIGSPIASKGNEFYPVITSNGSLYFNSDRDGNSDIYFSKYQDGYYSEPLKLPNNINTERTEADAFIARDESYIIFVRVDEEDGYGKSDLYISFNLSNDKWTEPVNMGEEVNSTEIDGSPYVTPDGNYLIFTSGRLDPNIKKEAMSSYANFKKTITSSGNGSLNFYIISLELEKYK